MTRGRVLFRADASHAIGFGHVTRLSALIEETARAGYAPVAMFGGDRDAISRWAQGRRLPLELHAWTTDDTVRAASARDVRAIVVDGPGLARELVPALRVPVVLVDDAGTDAAVATVVNHNVHAPDLAYPGAHQRLLGRRYLMLREELVRHSRGSAPTEPRPGERLRIVITFGGSDPVGATVRVLAMVPADRPLALCVIAGPGFRDDASLADAAARAEAAGHTVELHRSPPDPGALFARAHGAICSAGGTLGELAYLGCPALAYAIVPDQVAPAIYQLADGVIAGGRTWSQLDDATLRDDLRRFVLDDAGRRTLRERALVNVDAEGVRRIVAAALG